VHFFVYQKGRPNLEPDPQHMNKKKKGLGWFFSLLQFDPHTEMHLAFVRCTLLSIIFFLSFISVTIGPFRLCLRYGHQSRIFFMTLQP
jgi:hypothetical protein